MTPTRVDFPFCELCSALSIDTCTFTLLSIAVDSAGDSEGSGKGILSAVMSRITGSTDKALDTAGSDSGTEGKPAEEPKKKSMPEFQASLPPVSTRQASA